MNCVFYIENDRVNVREQRDWEIGCFDCMRAFALAIIFSRFRIMYDFLTFKWKWASVWIKVNRVSVHFILVFFVASNCVYRVCVFSICFFFLLNSRRVDTTKIKSKNRIFQFFPLKSRTTWANHSMPTFRVHLMWEHLKIIWVSFRSKWWNVPQFTQQNETRQWDYYPVKSNVKIHDLFSS